METDMETRAMWELLKNNAFGSSEKCDISVEFGISHSQGLPKSPVKDK